MRMVSNRFWSVKRKAISFKSTFAGGVKGRLNGERRPCDQPLRDGTVLLLVHIVLLRLRQQITVILLCDLVTRLCYAHA